jgi:hypothetical protein
MEITGTGSFTDYNPTFTDAQAAANEDWDNASTHYLSPTYTDVNGAPEFIGSPPQIPSMTQGQEFPNGVR